MNGISRKSCVGLLVLVGGLLGGCGATLPPQKPITEGIFSAPPSKAPATAATGGKDKVAVVVISQNTKANVEYLTAQKADKEGSTVLRVMGSGSTLDAYAEASDPNFALTWMAKKLKSEFGTVKLVSDPGSLPSLKFDYLIVLDAVYQSTGWGRDNATATITTQFYDSQRQYIGDVKGYRDERLRNGLDTPSGVDLFRANHAVRVAALQDWDGALDRFVQQPRATAAPSSGTDNCVQAALSVENSQLRQRAIAACGS
ncbi:MAG: hypothetical protein QM805_20985 [Pseudomonas sp.]